MKLYKYNSIYLCLTLCIYFYVYLIHIYVIVLNGYSEIKKIKGLTTRSRFNRRFSADIVIRLFF